MIDIPKKAKKFVLAKHFDGLPKLEDFQLIEVDIPELQTGGDLVRLFLFSTYVNLFCFYRNLGGSSFL